MNESSSLSTATRRPEIGKHTFETLTTGMYVNPTDCLREYVQNGVDAIEASPRAMNGRIDIGMRPKQNHIVIRDNGCGIRASEFARELQDIGRSRKKPHGQRGFRGIGRLGGLAYCERLVFRTKAQGEPVISEQTWDCKALKDLLSGSHLPDMTMQELIHRTSMIDTHPAEASEPSWFEVHMYGVTEPMLHDIPAVRNYLAQVAPVDYDSQKFGHADEIRRFMRKSVSNYMTVDLLVQNIPVLKPYADSVPMSRGPNRPSGSVSDQVSEIEFLTLDDDSDSVLAYAWLAKTRFKGMVDDASGVNGVRVRVGNIGLGDGTALECCFPRSNRRFASYLVGELHAVHPSLRPNARRDGFEAGPGWYSLQNAFARKIADPKTKTIRAASKLRSQGGAVTVARSTCLQIEEQAEKGVVADQDRELMKEDLKRAVAGIEGLGAGVDAVKEEAEEAQHIVDQAPRLVDLELSVYSLAWRNRIQGVLDILYDEADDKNWAKRTARKMVTYLKHAKISDRS